MMGKEREWNGIALMMPDIFETDLRSKLPLNSAF
jgi:hypothetical protein